MIPRLHQTWARAKQQHGSALAVQRAHLSQRRQRLERQSQRLLDAYQPEIISLDEPQTRRRKLTAEVQQIAQACEQLITNGLTREPSALVACDEPSLR